MDRPPQGLLTSFFKTARSPEHSLGYLRHPRQNPAVQGEDFFVCRVLHPQLEQKSVRATRLLPQVVFEGRDTGVQAFVGRDSTAVQRDIVSVVAASEDRQIDGEVPVCLASRQIDLFALQVLGGPHVVDDLILCAGLRVEALRLDVESGSAKRIHHLSPLVPQRGERSAHGAVHPVTEPADVPPADTFPE